MIRFFVALLLVPLLLAGGPAAWAGATQEAVLAGGCFWCLEHDLESVPGVISAESGYSGGHVDNPTYRQVSGETTGHQESVRVRFDSGAITYATLLRHYWRNVDPLDGDGQFCDRGDSYRPVIFTDGDDQVAAAQTSAAAVARELQVPADALKVQIRPAARFWPAEDYHQNWYAKLGETCTSEGYIGPPWSLDQQAGAMPAGSGADGSGLPMGAGH